MTMPTFATVSGSALTLITCLLSACAVPTVGKPDEAYTKEAWAYFKRKCETESGERIYRQVTGTKSVQVVRPLSPASEKDIQDQFWLGDPYSSSSTYKRAERAALALASWAAPVAPRQEGNAFDFVESPADDTGGYIKYYYLPSATKHTSEVIERPVSRFGLSWEDISSPEDRNYWIAGSRLRVIDLTDNSIVAERIGYLIEYRFGSTVGGRRPWLNAHFMGKHTSCPETHDYTDRWFVLKALNPPPKLEILDIEIPQLRITTSVGQESFVNTTAIASFVHETPVNRIPEVSIPRSEGFELSSVQHSRDGASMDQQLVLRSEGRKVYILQGLGWFIGWPLAARRFGDDVVVVWGNLTFVGDSSLKPQKKLFVVRRFDSYGRLQENFIAYAPEELVKGRLAPIENALSSIDGGYSLRIGRTVEERGEAKYSLVEVRLVPAR